MGRSVWFAAVLDCALVAGDARPGVGSRDVAAAVLAATLAGSIRPGIPGTSWHAELRMLSPDPRSDPRSASLIKALVRLG